MKLIENLRDCADPSLVGGKAANLGALLRAGFNVPDGFVVTPAANGHATELIREAHQKLAASTVAVRSSATIEDGCQVSMAGQFRTVLNVSNEAELVQAIEHCRASAQDSRVAAYLAAQDREPSGIEMAVIVQRQLAPEAAGVLFTSGPLHHDEMVIEAVPGPGEDLVSGRTQPDSFRLNAKTGEIIETRAAQTTPVLTQQAAAKLWALGRDVAAYFGTAQDIEWAISGDELFLLQARPITTSGGATDEASLIEETRKALALSGRGPWVLHNLAETLPNPTPLTWSVLRRFMSGAGGFGAAYARLGFASAAGEILELICGRVYLDLSRAPEIFGVDFPFAYDPETLRRDPRAAQSAPTIPRGSWPARLRASRRMAAAQRRIDLESKDFDRRLAERIIPDFVAWCAEEKRRDLAALAVDEWIALWRAREQRVLGQFASEMLFANLIGASAFARLRDFLAEHFWNDEPDALAHLLVSANAPTRTLIADGELREVAEGRRPSETWLADHGHRALGEFDLAEPRWRERPRELAAYAARMKDGRDPLALHRERAAQAAERIVNLPPHAARQLREKLDLACRYLRFREDGKDDLMRGYDLLRDMALEAARRLKRDVFWLTSDELCEALRGGRVPRDQGESRKRAHRADARVTLPHFIDHAALATLGETPIPGDHDHFRGLAISSGAASGPLRIVKSPLNAADLGGGYVLCCPSTDPAWTPLFVNAAALILECGGTLSHGAIVARELNLPAVVLPDAMRLLREGEHVFVDGSRGVVARKAQLPASDADEIHIAAEKVPPVAGQRERRGARWRNFGFVLWGVSLVAAWMLPAPWLYQPAIHALDGIFWPLVRAFGKPATVAIAGAGLALISAIMQALFTDNARLREASRRARILRVEAAKIPSDSARRHALLASAVPVRWRVTGANLVPVGLLLGVLVMTFSWFPLRMEQTNPEPGTSARVVATVEADFRDPITLSVPLPLRLDESSKPTRLLPLIRETLESLSHQGDLTEAARADLQRYLHNGVPPQELVWIVHCDEPGAFPATLISGKAQPVSISVAFGGDLPPPDMQRVRVPGHGMLSVKVENPAPKMPFWVPHGEPIPLRRDIDWLTVYLAAYLPTWLLARRCLALV